MCTSVNKTIFINIIIIVIIIVMKSGAPLLGLAKSIYLYNLRSTGHGKLLLDHPKGKMLTTLGARSFSAAAPKLWNELPVELRQATSLNSFKSRLKTYLFKKYFL